MKMLQLLGNFVLPPELRPWTLLGDFGPPDPLTNLFPLCPQPLWADNAIGPVNNPLLSDL